MSIRMSFLFGCAEMNPLFFLLISFFLCSFDGKVHDVPLQHNLFHKRGTQSPSVFSISSLLSRRDELSVLSAAVTPVSQFPHDEWFFGSAENIPQAVRQLWEAQREGLYSSLYKRGRQHIYEGGVAEVKLGNITLIPCFYITSRNQHFILKDKPRTIGVAIFCEYVSDRAADKLCGTREIDNSLTELKLRVFPTNEIMHSVPPDSHQKSLGKFVGDLVSNLPSLYGSAQLTVNSNGNRISQNEKSVNLDEISICTVQTFKNEVSGIFLYLFTLYHTRLGMNVIIYDRFGSHYDYIKIFLFSDGSRLRYHPYTALQLAFPSIYTRSFALSQRSEYIQYFSRHIHDKKRQKAMSEVERMTQDQDKRRSYDMARLDYPETTAMLFVDSDEFLSCSENISAIDLHMPKLRQMIEDAVQLRYEEIQLPRISHFSTVPPTWRSASFSGADAVEASIYCLKKAYINDRSNLGSYLRCWSALGSPDKAINPKSFDLFQRCPFHYNHYSCAIHEPYRREKYRCDCRKLLAKASSCRIMHFNNKFMHKLSDNSSIESLKISLI